MKAIFIKELRENASWALIMSVVLAATLSWGLSTEEIQIHSLVGTTMFAITSILFPAIGFTLGLLQILQDSNPGRWAFLAHRPISLSRIFFAKVIAGLCLYLPATAIPVIGAIAWVASPGHVAAPFEWHMILPRLADLLGGSMWYAAGLLVGARPARWVGSRLAPLGLAFIGTAVAASMTRGFWDAILVFAIVLLILLPAAWGNFMTRGSFERQPLLFKAMTLLALAFGMNVALLAIGLLLWGLISWLASPTELGDRGEYALASDGQPLIVWTSGISAEKVTDLKGHKIPASVARTRTGLNLGTIMLNIEQQRRFQGNENYLIQLGTVDSTNWYYVVGRRTIEGYYQYSKQLVGGFGTGGFVSGRPQPFAHALLAFPDPPSTTATELIASSETTTYRIDLSKASVRPLFVADPGDPIYNAMEAPMEDDPQQASAPHSALPLIVVTRSAIHVVEGGKERFRVPMTHTFALAAFLMVKKTPDGGFVFTDEGPLPFSAAWLVETDREGHVTLETELPALPQNLADEPAWINAPQWLFYPPVFFAFPDKIDSATGKSRYDLPKLFCSILVSVGSVWATWWLTRRVKISRWARGCWIVSNALLGCGGVLLLLSLYQRVATVRCPKCDKRRRVTSERCERCNSAFAAPTGEIAAAMT